MPFLSIRCPTAESPLPAALAASCAFMLPVTTPPNAIVFGSGYVGIPDMLRVGIVLNVLGVIVITAMTQLILPYVFSRLSKLLWPRRMP